MKKKNRKSYKNACLCIDDTMWCDESVDPSPPIQWFRVHQGGKMIAFGKSAASAWQAAWEKLMKGGLNVIQN